MGLSSMQNQPHQQQGQQTTQQQTQYPRPASVVQPQHAQAPQTQHHPSYASTQSVSSVYQSPGNQSTPSHNSSDGSIPYYAHGAYNPPGATSGYSSAGMSISRVSPAGVVCPCSLLFSCASLMTWMRPRSPLHHACQRLAYTRDTR